MSSDVRLTYYGQAHRAGFYTGFSVNIPVHTAYIVVMPTTMGNFLFHFSLKCVSVVLTHNEIKLTLGRHHTSTTKTRVTYGNGVCVSCIYSHAGQE